MSGGVDLAEQPTLFELIAAGDPDAVAGFYDARVASVCEYCAEVLTAELVDEAVLAAFVDFLGRVGTATASADPDDLLRKSARLAAASRVQVSYVREPACRGVAEVVAALASDELQHDEEPIARHLKRCWRCRGTARHLMQAEDAFVRPPAGQPSEEVRAAWLELASRIPVDAVAELDEETETVSKAEWAPEHEREAVAEGEPGFGAEQKPQQAATMPESPSRGRLRRGGLVGAARRLASSKRRR
jgi:hypothetical protein